ncbi:hypothetical protein BEI60_12935 [Eisenbergiella tayi]|uniref:Uncharacterized protein n=1 Tax=Eisenbergiella tayi TaxID=1432052 RepID=A0ABX3A9K8_9FIRM|nr:hypothetical protein BEI60_12935 [Eisenbergiella tayi]ODR40640.1 hypothetical protein BEI62_13495 [Eisenbergiella tayi]ODR45760.1 hypothetical protein BEI63_28695 [Eisenbergiella tayi]
MHFPFEWKKHICIMYISHIRGQENKKRKPPAPNSLIGSAFFVLMDSLHQNRIFFPRINLSPFAYTNL